MLVGIGSLYQKLILPLPPKVQRLLGRTTAQEVTRTMGISDARKQPHGPKGEPPSDTGVWDGART